MRTEWERRNSILGAVSFAFIASAPAVPGIYEYSITPSDRVEFSYITPTPPSITDGLYEYQTAPDSRVAFFHMTPYAIVFGEYSIFSAVAAPEHRVVRVLEGRHRIVFVWNNEES